MAPARRIPRPVFRRKETYVAIRPMRRGDTVIEAGDTLEGFKQHTLKYLYRRRRIGIKGHPWTEAMLSTTGFPKLMPKVVEQDVTEEPDELDTVQDELLNDLETDELEDETSEAETDDGLGDEDDDGLGDELDT